MCGIDGTSLMEEADGDGEEAMVARSRLFALAAGSKAGNLHSKYDR